MNKKYLVSVVVPSYNHATFLEKRLDSILSQTYPNFEVIILDDCSTDNSMDILYKYRNDPRVSSIIQNESNSGSPFAQWKNGLALCKGDLVWIAESDDACADTFLDELVDFYQKNDLVMAFSLSKRLDSTGTLCETIQKSIIKDIIMEGKDYISNHISLITNASSAIFSRICALKIDNNYYDYKGTGDWLFWSGIAKQGNVGVLAKPLNYYRVHDNSTTTKMFSNGRDFEELWDVYNYFYKNALWNKSVYLKNRIRMLYGIKYIYKFDSENVKNRLLEKWKMNSVLSGLLTMRFIAAKLLKRLRAQYIKE